MSKALNYLGIARKAGCIEIGEENTGIAVRAGKARLALLASDASDNARRRAEGFVNRTNTPLLTVPFSKTEISDTVGKNGCSMAAFTDIGLASSFVSALRQEYGEDYSELAGLLEERLNKARQRKSEARAHERNRKTGNRRSSV
ncbi:MAG: L7Ae/L30e/S12e/Gadd45 family ribosomal protein [Oscillospiraceae bacterium]